MMSPVYAFRCGCCDLSGFQLKRPHVEVDLGLVCEVCRPRLIIASSVLKRAGLRICTHAAENKELRPLLGMEDFR